MFSAYDVCHCRILLPHNIDEVQAYTMSMPALYSTGDAEAMTVSHPVQS